MTFLHGFRSLCLGTLTCLLGQCAYGFILSDPDFTPWLTTASGTRNGNGRPVTLTWSIVPDGTDTPDDFGGLAGSNLISFLDANFGGNPAGGDAADYTQRPWFEFVAQPFERWETVSGIDFVYEPHDDGSELGDLDGLLGVRGDIRLSGRNIDGAGSTLAFNYLPDVGDMVLDTSEAAFFGNAINNYRRFRNTIAHELGHGLNLDHVTTTTDLLLLEPNIALAIDGPQLDEIAAVHFLYGDALEKTNSGAGNETAVLATPLGLLLPGSLLQIGGDADLPTQLIDPPFSDLVSISSITDVDFFSFVLSAPGSIDAVLAPLGGQFTQGTEFGSVSTIYASAYSDLSLTIFDTDGTTPLVTRDETGAGQSEILTQLPLLRPGKYYASVTGAADWVQLYQLQLSVEALSVLTANFNHDETVDQDDLVIWQSSYGMDSQGDADFDNDTDAADFLAWQRQLGQMSNSAAAATAVPEPASAILLGTGLLAASCAHKHRQRKINQKHSCRFGDRHG